MMNPCTVEMGKGCSIAPETGERVACDIGWRRDTATLAHEMRRLIGEDHAILGECIQPFVRA